MILSGKQASASKKKNHLGSQKNLDKMEELQTESKLSLEIILTVASFLF